MVLKDPEKTGENRNEKGQFVKGISGNPNGRPEGAGISITTEIKRMLLNVPAGQKSTYLQLLIVRILNKAISEGDTNLIKAIWNYIDGMPQQDITSAGEKLDFPVIYKPMKDKSI